MIKNQLTLLRQVITIEHIDTMCRHSADCVYVNKSVGTCSYHCAYTLTILNVAQFAVCATSRHPHDYWYVLWAVVTTSALHQQCYSVHSVQCCWLAGWPVMCVCVCVCVCAEQVRMSIALCILAVC